MARVQIQQTHVFRADAETIWPAVGRSNLVSELAGMGRYEAVEELQADGSVLRRAHGGKMRPFTRTWTEDLGQWVYARYCAQRRWFAPDGDQYVDYAVALEPNGETTRVHTRVDIRSTSPIIWLGAQLGMVQRGTQKIIDAQLALIESEIARATDVEAPDLLTHLRYQAPPLSANARQRLTGAHRHLTGLYGDQGLPDRLVEFLTHAPDDPLGRIRPLELAQAWRCGSEEVVDLFLAAHHAALVSLRWEVLCPNCRNARTPATRLEELPHHVHCATCNIDYERDFSHNVELLFAPEPWLRPLPDGLACMMGAATTPHIVVQRHVEAGETIVVDPLLRPGGYRVRAPQRTEQLAIDWNGVRGFPAVVAEDGRLALGEPGDAGRITLRNDGGSRVTFVIEEQAWRRNALTGDQAIARAAFRRYCPDQLLRPGDDVRIANVTLMFTDLQSSTSLYERIGDTAAFKLVRDHFEYLADIVERHRGTLVKTMGDAIIAAFSDGADAILAAVQLQSGIAAFNRGRDDGGVVLKIGLHLGPCIAVTADGRLDYFGSMVNLAARLQGESRGGEIVASTELVHVVDASTRDRVAQDFRMEKDRSHLRGFERPVDYWRLVPRDAEAPVGAATEGQSGTA